MSEQGGKKRRVTEVEWHQGEAVELLDSLAFASHATARAIAAGGWLDDLVWQGAGDDQPVFRGAGGLAAIYGGLRGALEMYCERWGLPADVMERERRRTGQMLDSAPRGREPEWGLRESSELLRALAKATYGVASAVAANGKLERIAVAPLDDEIAPEEWLAEVFGFLHAAATTAILWWVLPMDEVTVTRHTTRRRLQRAWRREAGDQDG